ncbi:COG1361 S-layer family protein [Haloarcula sp. GH36]|uniref:COG1361 S-layer family protein n=1 Tax=Haloarcula montana TaxID=3111776 RepID=UPI002D799A8F|nr:sialidase [Haloarcula sp. GH36]
MNSRTLLTLAVVALLLLVPGIAAGAVVGSPDITATLTDSTVVPGEETRFDVVLTNTGSLDTASARNPNYNSQVTTARGLQVDVLDGGGPFTITTEQQVYGSLPETTTQPISFNVVVHDDAEPGTYRVPVDLKYKYTEYISETTGDRDERTATTREYVTVKVSDRAKFDVTDVDSNARVASTGTVAVTVENTGSEAASDASVAFEASSSDLSVGGQQASSRYVSQWEPGEVRTFRYRVGSTANAEADSYEFDLSVNFEDEDGADRSSARQSVGVDLEREQTFSVTDLESDVSIGDTGTYNVTFRNDGPVAVNDATVQITSQSSDISFSGSESSTQYVGAWQPGETRTVRVEATTSEDAQVRPYALVATVGYTDPEGDAGADENIQLGLQPEPEQTFSLTDVESNLRAGDDGRLNATLTNTGRNTVRNVVLVWRSDNTNISPQKTEYAVGDLEPGASAEVSFGVDISDGAEGGPRQFDFATRYRNREGDRRESDTIEIQQSVADGTDEFRLDTTDVNVSVGQSKTIELTITNVDTERLTNIEAKLFTDSPISATDDEAFIASLEPGESETLTFGISASGTAMQKTYPISMDFQYEEPDGDTPVSDTYRVPISVTERSGGGGLPLGLIGAVVLLSVLAVAGYIRYR